MQKPQKFITRMVLFMAVVLGLAGLLRGPLVDAFSANPGLNGTILAVLVLGTFYAFRRVFELFAEVRWITAFKRQDGTATSGGAPNLMAPAAKLLEKSSEGRMRLSALSMRSVLDGLVSRLEESREISRYLTQLLIFLGLLGTFWGLILTVGSVGGTFEGLAVDGSDVGLMLDELKAGIQAPLSGMATAFASSLFGLAGSLILGFMDLQASQAQTRFYNDVEDWLASVTHLSSGEADMSSPGAYMTALMEQTADGIDKLARTMARADDGRAQLQTSMTEIAQSIASLADKMSGEGANTKALASAIEKLANHDQTPVMDEATRGHIRNLDVGIKRLAEEQARASDLLVDELRAELKLLARTIAAGLDQAATGDREPRRFPAPTQPLERAQDTREAEPQMTIKPLDAGRPLTAERDGDDQ